MLLLTAIENVALRDWLGGLQVDIQSINSNAFTILNLSGFTVYSDWTIEISYLTR